MLVPHYVHSALKLDNFVLKCSILHTKMAELFFKVLACLLVFVLPLLCNFLLLNHYFIGTLFTVSVFLLVFQQLVFKLSNLDVALVVQLIDSIMVNDLESV